MHDVMRKRLMRKLEALPEERLYQVLDYIEFLESRYATAPQPEPGTLQRLGEQLEDGLRALSVGPRAVTGTMRLFGTANRIVDGITEAGKELMRTLDTPPGAAPTAPRVGRGTEGAASAPVAAVPADEPPPGASAVARDVPTEEQSGETRRE